MGLGCGGGPGGVALWLAETPAEVYRIVFFGILNISRNIYVFIYTNCSFIIIRKI